MRKSLMRFVLPSVFVLLLLPAVSFAIPNTITVYNLDGVDIFIGISGVVAYTYTATIYDAPVNGNALWSETLNLPENYRSHIAEIGLVNPIPANLFTRDALYVEMTLTEFDYGVLNRSWILPLGGTIYNPVGDDIPLRQRIDSSAYAINPAIK